MAYIKFRNSKDFVKCLIEPKGNIVSLAFPLGEAISTNTSGFDTYLDDKGELLIGEYGAYTTVYRNWLECLGLFPSATQSFGADMFAVFAVVGTCFRYGCDFGRLP